jgi:hypothetical protein
LVKTTVDLRETPVGVAKEDPSRCREYMKLQLRVTPPSDLLPLKIFKTPWWSIPNQIREDAYSNPTNASKVPSRQDPLLSVCSP